MLDKLLYTLEIHKHTFGLHYTDNDISITPYVSSSLWCYLVTAHNSNSMEESAMFPSHPSSWSADLVSLSAILDDGHKHGVIGGN